MTKTKKLNRLKVEADRQKIGKKQQEAEKLLEDGYRATAKQSLKLTKQFENADFADWDDI